MPLLPLLADAALLSGISFQTATFFTYLMTRQNYSEVLYKKGFSYWTFFWLIPFILHTSICLMLSWQNYAPFAVSGLIMLVLYAVNYIFIERKNTKAVWRQVCMSAIIPFIQVYLSVAVFLGLK